MSTPENKVRLFDDVSRRGEMLATKRKGEQVSHFHTPPIICYKDSLKERYEVCMRYVNIRYEMCAVREE